MQGMKVIIKDGTREIDRAVVTFDIGGWPRATLDEIASHIAQTFEIEFTDLNYEVRYFRKK